MAEPDEWRQLFVKKLTITDMHRSKLFSPGAEDQKDFLESIPDEDRHKYMNEKKIPARLHTHQGTYFYAVTEVLLKIKFPGDHIQNERCSFVLPGLQSPTFEYDLDVKVEYCWRDKKLHLRAAMADPKYPDLPPVPSPWRLLGEKLIMNSDITNRVIKFVQSDMREFYYSIPTDELKECLMKNVGFRVGIWMRRYQCIVVGMLKASHSTQMDITSLGFELSCCRAYDERPEFFRVNEEVQVYYKWACGTLFLAIVPNRSLLPDFTGDWLPEF